MNNGTKVKDGTIFVYGLLICSECAKNVAQSGIKHVVVMTPDSNSKWYSQWTDKTVPIFEECGVKISTLTESDINRDDG